MTDLNARELAHVLMGLSRELSDNVARGTFHPGQLVAHVERMLQFAMMLRDELKANPTPDKAN